MTPGRLLLIPTPLGDGGPPLLPPEHVREIQRLRRFVVENEKPARAALKRLGHPGPIAALLLQRLPESPAPAALDVLLAPCLEGEDLGLMSDAGCPGVADPGAALVARAHRRGIAVVPLVGPSAILLALMGSGLDGQRFAFHGYLPIPPSERAAAIAALEAESRARRQSQFFIETPYRNERMLETLAQVLVPTTLLCVACHLTQPDQWIRTAPVARWRAEPLPTLGKRPTVFGFLAQQ